MQGNFSSTKDLAFLIRTDIMCCARKSLSRSAPLLHRVSIEPSNLTCLFCQQTRSYTRFSTSARAKQHDDRPFRTRLKTAVRRTKAQWKPIPVGLGIAFLGAVQFSRVREQAKRKQQEEDEVRKANEVCNEDVETKGRPRKRDRIRPSGPW